MAVHVIRMPDPGEGIAEVELVAWHVKPGDVVAEDQILADVMTDKATIEVPSSVAGTVIALGGDVGQVLAVGAELIRIEGEATGRAPKAAQSAVPAPSMPTPPAPAPMPAPAPIRPPAPAPAATASAVAAASPTRTARPIASPSVRARAWELGIDLSQVRASGPAGRIVHADLDAHMASGAARSTARPAAARAAQADTTGTVKIVGLRRKIAQKMQESKRRIPHYSYVEEVDVTEMEALREHFNAKWEGRRPRLTPLAFIARAIVGAVAETPEVNATFDDEVGVVTRHGAVHLGIATQTDFGLLVPVLRDAQALDLWGLADEAARVAALARSGKATRGELTGSTLTITSLGKLGGIVTTPVINHPEVAIVGVNKIVERPVIRSGAVVPRLIMNLSSSFDHRVIDGAVAAEFIQRIRERLEHPGALFVD
jgi:2-oxoisovalerate dehydrogenase E2 component (dihydrolipoyl transacylase)